MYMLMRDAEERKKEGSWVIQTMKGTKVQTLGGRAVAGAWLVAWAIMAMGAIINTHAHR